VERCGLNSSESGKGPVVEFYVHGNEPSGSTKVEETKLPFMTECSGNGYEWG